MMTEGVKTDTVINIELGDAQVPDQSRLSLQDPFPLHTAAYLGDLERVEELLYTAGTGPSTRSIDGKRMTPLHHAARGTTVNATKICKILIEADLKHNSSSDKEPLVKLRDFKGKTALHYAAAFCTFPEIVKVLLDSGADPSAKDEHRHTALDFCATYNSDAALECAKYFHVALSKLPDPTTGRSQRAVHIAARNEAPKMLAFLLENGYDHRTTYEDGLTALMGAAQTGDSAEGLECVRILLKYSTPEDINAQGKYCSMTALMKAAEHSHPNMLELLLGKEKTNLFATDKDGRTAMHCAVHNVYGLACIKLLAESKQITSSRDKKELLAMLYGSKNRMRDLPIDTAIKCHRVGIAEYLIVSHPTPHLLLTTARLDKIYSELPEAILPLMNQCLKYDPAKQEKVEEIQAEFGPVTCYSDPFTGLTDSEKHNISYLADHGEFGHNNNFSSNSSAKWGEPRQETRFLHHVLSSAKDIQKKIFLHPLVQIFIDLKWEKFRQLAWIVLAFQFVWIILYTAMIRSLHIGDCIGEISYPENVTDFVGVGNVNLPMEHPVATPHCEVNPIAGQILSVFLYLFSSVLLTKELFQMKYVPKYFHYHHWMNYIRVFVLVSSFLNTIPAWLSPQAIPNWLKNVVPAFGIFMAWILFLREVAKLPWCGIYVAIFRKVFLHCLKMIICFVALLIGFGECLRILVPGKGQYSYFFLSLAKMVIMMAGELDYEDTFYYGNGPSLAFNAVLGQIVFVMFVFITVIVLLNLVTGLAVNDVQSLMKEAEINRLSSELQQIYEFETFILWLGKKNIAHFKKWKIKPRHLNVTSATTAPYFSHINQFSTRQTVKTKGYPHDLKLRIREILTPFKDSSNKSE